MTDTTSKTALIVGASRGLGLGLVEDYLGRGWRVIATVRPGSSAEMFAELQAAHGEALTIERVDINLPETVAALGERLAPSSLDLLFVNAGVSLGAADNVSTVTDDEFAHLMVTNALSPMRVITALLPSVKPAGSVAAMSSRLGSVALNTDGAWEVYRASKASLNTLMRSFALRQGDGRTYLCVSPGWVRTDMGGDEAPLDVATSVAGMASAIAARAGATGAHYVDYENHPIEW